MAVVGLHVSAHKSLSLLRLAEGCFLRLSGLALPASGAVLGKSAVVTFVEVTAAIKVRLAVLTAVTAIN